MTPSSLTFHQTHRAYGTRIPLDDVPAHLACGWRPIEDTEEMHWPDRRLLLKPPAVFLVNDPNGFGVAHPRSLPDGRLDGDSVRARQAHLTPVVPVIHSMEPVL